jgi:hypothetical protein
MLTTPSLPPMALLQPLTPPLLLSGQVLVL